MTRPKAAWRPRRSTPCRSSPAAFGAGVAGVVVNTAENRTASDLSDLVAARWLFAVFAVLGALGVASLPTARRDGGR